MATPPSTKRSGTPGLLKRHGAALACAVALGASGEALAEDNAPRVKWGVMLDVGVPDGIGASAVFKPLQWLRLNAGVTSNTISVGMRGGVSLLPLSTFLAPSFNLEAGRYLGGDYNTLVERLGGSTSASTALISDVSYNYASASVGLNVGPANSWGLFLNVGLSLWELEVNDFEEFLQDTTEDGRITSSPLQVRFTSPSLKMGFIYYF